MYGNGAKIGMEKTIMEVAQAISRKDQIVGITAFCVAALGALMMTTSVLPIAAGAVLLTGTTPTAFA